MITNHLFCEIKMLFELSILPVEIQQKMIKNQHLELKLVGHQVMATPVVKEGRTPDLLAHLNLNIDDDAFTPLNEQEIKEYFGEVFT